jgi:hypothetical protein
VRSTLIVPEVLESQGASESLSQYIEKKCGAEVLQGRPSKRFDGRPWVMEVSFAVPASAQRAEKLAENGEHQTHPSVHM